MALRIFSSFLRNNIKNACGISRFSSVVGESGEIEAEAPSELAKKPVRDPDVNPIMKSRELFRLPQFTEPRQAWIETLDSLEDKVVGLTHLHPEIFGANPRIDLIHSNVRWQTHYRKVSFTHVPNRYEKFGSNRKPRPQKGMGLSRHGTRKSPLFKNTGGKAKGPRDPTTYFYMLGWHERLAGLTATLSIKHAQDDLRIVDSLDLPTDNPDYLKELVERRNWGPSVLFVDVPDLMPRNITAATYTVGHYNLMPVYGLNVYSMLKHDTLVLTIDAVKRIEEKLLYHMHRVDKRKVCAKFRINQQ